jgi:hypothetical protein
LYSLTPTGKEDEAGIKKAADKCMLYHSTCSKTSICGQCRWWLTTSKSSKGSPHHLNDTIGFNVLSKDHIA